MSKIIYYYSKFYFLLNNIAAIHPGIQPAQVKIRVNKTAPHPLSKTASGGKIIHKIALPKPIIFHLSLSFKQFL